MVTRLGPLQPLRAAAVGWACATLVGCSPAAPAADAGAENDAGWLDGGLDADAGLDGGPHDDGRLCAALPFAAPDTLRVGYFESFDGPSSAIELRHAGPEGVDVLSVELWYFGASANPDFPYGVMLWPTTRRECSVCLSLRRGCDAGGQACQAAYLAFGGSVVFDEATRDAGGGTLRGSVAQVRLMPWDFVGDRARTDAGCLEVTAVPFAGRWPLDGGP